MNTTTKTETRGRPKIYESVSERYKANNLRKKELHPEKYKAHGSRIRPSIYCEVCEKSFINQYYKAHFLKRRHIQAVLKKEESSSNETVYISE